VALVLVAAVATSAAAAAGDEAATPATATTAVKATIKDAPQAYLRGCLSNARGRMDGKFTGDGWTWHANYPMDSFIESYLATRDRAWLDAAVEYFDWCIEQLLTGPDGRKGWLGAAYRMPGRLGEYPLGDCLLLEPMLRFSELVLKDEPALADAYGKSAASYVALARQLIFEKWDHRGIWHEDGPCGVYPDWPWTFTEKEPDHWQPPPAGTHASTLPINMQVHWGMAALRLWRITGEPAWRDRALKIFNFAKSRLNLYDDHYSWNYWEPFGPWDIKPDRPQDFVTWINTPPYRDYQLGEVRAFVEAYQRGITFDETDMRRLVRTNLHVMWNGKTGDDVAWNNSNAGVQKGAFGEIRLPSKPEGMFNRYAGTLWTSLVAFDATARQLYEAQLAPGTWQHAFYHNVTAAQPPSFQRRLAPAEAAVFKAPLHPCCTITMVAVIPTVVQRGSDTVLACQGRLPGALKIELATADGGKVLRTLKEAELKLIVNHPWSTGDVKPGRYRIRWTLKGQYREMPVEVR